MYARLRRLRRLRRITRITTTTAAIIVAGMIVVAVVASTSALHAYGSEPQNMHIFVISDSTGCPADIIKKGMALPDPAGNKKYFPEQFEVSCIDVPAKTEYVNSFQYIEKVTVPALRKASQQNEEHGEQLYLFVYQQSLENQFREYIATRFGEERAKMVDGWANIPEGTGFSPIWAGTIYHEGRHLAIHGTWHDEAGRPLPNNQVIKYPGFGS